MICACEQYNIAVYTPGAMAEKLSPTILYAIFLPAFLYISLSLSVLLSLSLKTVSVSIY